MPDIQTPPTRPIVNPVEQTDPRSGPQMTWLLEVLNEVRVGSWLNLGKPDNLERLRLAQDEAKARHLWSMELSGYFQMALLAALNQTTQ